LRWKAFGLDPCLGEDFTLREGVKYKKTSLKVKEKRELAINKTIKKSPHKK